MWPGVEPFHSAWFIAIAGWFWGSFLNQVVDRTPRKHDPDDAWTPGLLHPRRSVCLQCRAPLPWYENIPIFAYLWLRGRCRHCGAAIGLRTLAMEVATPLLMLGWLYLMRPAPGTMALFWAGVAALSWIILAVVLILERRRRAGAFRLIGFLLAGLVWVLVLRV